MTWTTFLMILSAIYIIYYAINIAYDFFLNRHFQTEDSDQTEIQFFDSGQPELILFDDDQISEQDPIVDNSITLQTEPADTFKSANVESNGGVSLKQLIALAKDDLIVFTKSIPY